MLRKNKKSLNFFGQSARAAFVISVAFLATACGSTTSNKNLRNYAGKVKSLEYYKDFTDYENPNQTQPSAAAADDNHDFFPPETHEPDPVTPGEIPPNTAAGMPVEKPAAVTPATSAPTTPIQKPAPIETPTAPVPAPVPRPTVDITPAGPETPTTPPRKAPRADTPQSGDCRLSDKPCFPVAGKASFTDDFGARRSGGRRHAGNDIFAAKLTPVVAIEDGIVDRADRSATNGSSRLSGNYIGINHGNGVRSLYIHLNNDSPGTNDGKGHGLMPDIQVGTHVKKGDLIGWVGNSGNAETTPSHLHFEMRVTNDKAAAKAGHKVAYFPVNPYSMLKEAEGNKMILSMALEY